MEWLFGSVQAGKSREVRVVGAGWAKDFDSRAIRHRQYQKRSDPRDGDRGRAR